MNEQPLLTDEDLSFLFIKYQKLEIMAWSISIPNTVEEVRDGSISLPIQPALHI